MPESPKDYYESLSKECTSIIQSTFKNNDSNRQSQAHQVINDLDRWVEVLDNKPEVILYRSAASEYQSALLEVAQGMYRQAFMGLRLFTELSLAGIYYSGHEYELRCWLKNEKDIIWNDINDPNNGVFSHNFVDAFNKPFRSRCGIYQQLIAEVHRSCSQYVHGNPNTQRKTPDSLEYSNDIFNEWHDRADQACETVLFALAMRYLPYLSSKDVNSIEGTLLDKLHHITEIRNFLN